MENAQEHAGPHPKALPISIALASAFLVFALAPRACGQKTGPETPSTSTYIAAAEELVRQKLRDPGSADFTGVTFKPAAGERPNIVCGKVNARNGFGGMAGLQRFVVGGTTALESEIGVRDMDQLWMQFC